MAPSSLPKSLKRKAAPAAYDDGSQYTIENVAQLEAQLNAAVQAGGSFNALADLVALARASDASAQATSKAIYALYRVQAVLLSAGTLSPGGDAAARTARAWVWDRLNAYTDILCGLLQDEDKALRTSALQILLSLLKHLSTALCAQTPASPQMHVAHFRKLASALVLCPPSHRTPSTDTTPVKKRKTGSEAVVRELAPDVREAFAETWLTVHDDVRWFFLREAATVIQTTSSPIAAGNLLSFLERLNTFPTAPDELNAWWVPELGAKPKGKKKATPADDAEEEDAPAAESDEDDWRRFFDEQDDTPVASAKKPPAKARRPTTLHASLHTLGAHRAVFTRCWLALLPRLASPTLTSRALAIFHRLVLPHLTRPVLVADWVGAAVDAGGATGLLALDTLFGLMTAHNLDYPSFYAKLYAFLDRDVLHVVHRARFFRLAEKCLSSTHLPATLLASFVKRLSRLALHAPPAALVAVVPFTYNLLKRHPALMVLIHRPPPEDGADPFDTAEYDPHKTGALGSSLWELRGACARHFHAPVGALFRVLEQPFTRPALALDDFADHGYTTLFETEVRKRVRQPPVVTEHKVEGCLFPWLGDSREVKVDIVAELWSFGA